METVRNPAVAGLFYPENAHELRTQVHQFVDRVPTHDAPVPKAIIAPHAGYIYSGPIAGSAYARLKKAAGRIRRVILLGPAHRVAIRGLALPSVKRFNTPLGSVAIDQEIAEALLALPQVSINDATHAEEHSLEVHLPFLQEVLGEFSLVPLVVGDATAAEVAEVLEAVWGGDETLIVISSDLSHYLDYDTASALDRRTSDAIESLDYEKLTYDQACGRIPVSGLLRVARKKGLHGETIDLRNSGDTAGPRDRVVGYGAYVFS
ncbi:MAG: AmmeMemoRadiSam system protein B [Acidiferrobacterales bacterium]